MWTDRRWLSSGKLADPWDQHDRWWLSRTSCRSFLDTDKRVFGRKKVFLVDKKTFPKSEGDLVIGQAWTNQEPEVIT